MTTRRLHYAWIVAVVTFLGLLTSAGVRTAPSVVLVPLEVEFGWTRSETSFAVAISLFVFGFGAPLGGALMDRFGPRRVLLGGLAVITAGLALMLTMDQLWQFHLWWGVVVGIGTGAVAGTLGATVATRWFNVKRGMVLGLFSAAAAAGQFLFTPTLIAAGTGGNWRAVILVLVGAGIAAGGLALVFMRSSPEDARTTAWGKALSASAVLADSRTTPLREAIRTRDFWLLAGSFFVCGYTTNGMIGTHLLPHALEHGFVEAEMAGAIAVMGVMNIVGSLISGALSERFDNRKLLATYYGFRALSLAALPFVLEMQGMLLFTIIYGFDWVATVPPTINLTAERFGRKSLGSIYGWIYCSHMIGAGIASFAGGFFRDHLGDYHLIFISAAIMGIVASGLTLGIKGRGVARPVPAAAAAD
ncbi:MAG: MFS transporter [Chloroflexi bacterium]|nr:MFS transporter [Chloroflexota bacterium]